MSLNQFLIIALLSLGTTNLAQAWSSSTVLSCTTSDMTAPFQKLEVVYLQRASNFYVVRIFKPQSRYFYENFTSAPTQHNKVIYTSYQISGSKEKMRFELMVHTPSLEAFVLFESNKVDQLSTPQPRTDFKCQILEPQLIG